MKGLVEVYSDYGTPNQRLIDSSPNLVVDKAGEMIADLMTLPLAGSGISSASAIYDTSNFTIRAVSFGKAASGYTEGGHAYNDVVVSGAATGSRIWVQVSGATAPSSYYPDLFLPDNPNPLDYKLNIIEANSLYRGGSSGLSAIEEFGQNVNLIQYGNPKFGGQTRLYLRAGSWPRSTGESVALAYKTGSNVITLVSSTGVSGNFNTVSSMDWRGYVTTTSSTNPLSGLVTSSTTTFSSTGEVIYQITIASGDALVANLFGGITQMGLWGLDLKTMLAAGRTPPYTAHPTTNVLDYRLFSKKVFNKNIVGINDNGSSAGFKNYSNLTIIWRIFFL